MTSFPFMTCSLLVPSTGDDGETESYAVIVRNRKKKCRGNVGSEKIAATLARWSALGIGVSGFSSHPFILLHSP
jgi:hypothetical protein